MGTVTSAKNPLLKEVRKAVRAASMTDSGLCVAEGFHLLAEALRSGCHIEEVLVTERAREALRERVQGLNDIPVVPLHERLFATVASTEATQGVIALVRPPSWTADDVFRGDALTVVVDGVQDPGNAGAILRAAEAFGASGAIFLKGTASPWNPKALRASAGSVFRLPLITGVDQAEMRSLAEQNQSRLYAAMPQAGRSVAECDLTERCAIVIGAEGRGVSPELAGSAESLSVPTAVVDSLNAGISAAVILYEARRQRSTAGGAAQ
ncbi:MAG TPA: RNA methyltransferase [Bryobacteraceae bacterium]|nr:RNA methyltransferase [Bryobacteraceae bacterium]